MSSPVPPGSSPTEVRSYRDGGCRGESLAQDLCVAPLSGTDSDFQGSEVRGIGRG